jgi:hypothetical protein
VILGLLLTALLAVARNQPPAGSGLLSDCDGSIGELVIHYERGSAGVVETVYRQFLGALPKEVTVFVVCPDRAAFEDLRKRLGRVACRLTPVPTGHPQTAWSRDRWLAVADSIGGSTWLLTPRQEIAAAVWPERAGDALVASDLASLLSGRVRSRSSALLFDGGDFVADDEVVFVAPAVLGRNLGATVGSADDLRAVLARLLKRRVVLLSQAPPHHAGMFMMPVGDKTVLVGDPSLAASGDVPLQNPDFSRATQKKFDAVAEQVRTAGYQVVRVPVAPDKDGRTYLTYLNVILDQRGFSRTVYLPVFQGAESLNRQAANIWRKLGYSVVRVDCSDAYIHFGSLRCLVGVLSRNPYFFN